jgi:hypothetical protein
MMHFVVVVVGGGRHVQKQGLPGVAPALVVLVPVDGLGQRGHGRGRHEDVVVGLGGVGGVATGAPGTQVHVGHCVPVQVRVGWEAVPQGVQGAGRHALVGVKVGQGSDGLGVGGGVTVGLDPGTQKH